MKLLKIVMSALFVAPLAACGKATPEHGRYQIVQAAYVAEINGKPLTKRMLLRLDTATGEALEYKEVTTNDKMISAENGWFQVRWSGIGNFTSKDGKPLSQRVDNWLQGRHFQSWQQFKPDATENRATFLVDGKKVAEADYRAQLDRQTGFPRSE